MKSTTRIGANSFTILLSVVNLSTSLYRSICTQVIPVQSPVVRGLHSLWRYAPYRSAWPICHLVAVGECFRVQEGGEVLTYLQCTRFMIRAAQMKSQKKMGQEARSKGSGLRSELKKILAGWALFYPLSGLSVDSDLARMHLYDFIGQRQTNPTAARGFVAIWFDAIKAFEQ